MLVRLSDAQQIDCSVESDGAVEEGQWVRLVVRYHSGAGAIEVRVNDKVVGQGACPRRLAALDVDHSYLGKASAAANETGPANQTGAANQTGPAAAGAQLEQLEAEVAGVLLQTRYLTVNEVALVVEEIEHGARVAPRAAFMVEEVLPEALLATIDARSSVIPSSSIRVTASLQAQADGTDACDAGGSWETLGNLGGTTHHIAQAGRVVFTDLHVVEIARPCMRVQFLSEHNVSTVTAPFAVFPRLAPDPAQGSLALAQMTGRQGHIMKALGIRSTDASGFNVVAELQTCSPRCHRLLASNDSSAECRPWMQEGFSPRILTSSSALIPLTQTLTSIGEGPMGFLEVQAASIILSEIRQLHRFPRAPNKFTVKLAFNVDVDSRTGITLSGLRSATKSTGDLPILEGDADARSAWFESAAWREGRGELELHIAQGVTAPAGHVLAFSFWLLNDASPRVAPPPEVAATDCRPAVLRSPEPLDVVPPRLEATAHAASSWPGRNNTITVSLSVTFDLEEGALLTVTGLHAPSSCQPWTVTGSCGEHTSSSTSLQEAGGSDVVVRLSRPLPAGEACSIAVSLVNSDQAQPASTLEVSLVSRHFNISKQAAATSSPIVVQEPTFIRAEYGLSSSGSFATPITITATLVPNIELAGDGADQDLILSISSHESAAAFPVEVTVGGSGASCLPDAAAEDARLSACLSSPSCRRNTTCSLQALSGSLCSSTSWEAAAAGAGSAAPCRARATLRQDAGQNGNWGPLSHTLQLRGQLPAGAALILRWNASLPRDPRVNLTCSVFGGRIFVLADALRETYGYDTTPDTRMPDFLAAASSQTSTWPGALNEIHLELTPGHTIPAGSVLEVSGFPGWVAEGDSNASVMAVAGDLVWTGLVTLYSEPHGTTNASASAAVHLRSTSDIFRGSPIHIVISLRNRVPRTATNDSSVGPLYLAVNVSRSWRRGQAWCGDCLCGDCFQEHAVIVHKPKDPPGSDPGDAVPLRVESPRFITLDVGQDTAFPAANNTISLTIVSNFPLLPASVLRVTSLDGAINSTLPLRSAFGAGEPAVVSFRITNPPHQRAAAVVDVEVLLAVCAQNAFSWSINTTATVNTSNTSTANTSKYSTSKTRPQSKKNTSNSSTPVPTSFIETPAPALFIDASSATCVSHDVCSQGWSWSAAPCRVVAGFLCQCSLFRKQTAANDKGDNAPLLVHRPGMQSASMTASTSFPAAINTIVVTLLTNVDMVEETLTITGLGDVAGRTPHEVLLRRLDNSSASVGFVCESADVAHVKHSDGPRSGDRQQSRRDNREGRRQTNKQRRRRDKPQQQHRQEQRQRDGARQNGNTLLDGGSQRRCAWWREGALTLPLTVAAGRHLVMTFDVVNPPSRTFDGQPYLGGTWAGLKCDKLDDALLGSARSSGAVGGGVTPRSRGAGNCLPGTLLCIGASVRLQAMMSSLSYLEGASAQIKYILATGAVEVAVQQKLLLVHAHNLILLHRAMERRIAGRQLGLRLAGPNEPGHLSPSFFARGLYPRRQSSQRVRQRLGFRARSALERCCYRHSGWPRGVPLASVDWRSLSFATI